MKINEILSKNNKNTENLNEVALTASHLVRHNGQYLINVIDKIMNGGEFPIVGKYQSTYGKTVTFDPSQAKVLKKLFYLNGDPKKVKISTGGNIIPPEPLRMITLKTTSGQNIPTGALEKTADIKGKDVDYNLGDIGEFAIAIAVYTRFIKNGETVSIADVVRIIKKLKFGYSKTGSSGIADVSSKITWPKGKVDEISLNSVLPRRSMDYILNNIKATGKIEEQIIQATFNGAIMYANDNVKVTNGIASISKNKKTNFIKISCDGVSDQKGTKADVIMNIDGTPINIVSAKVGRSQLGQASGHNFDKQRLFFKTVFNENVSSFKTSWGETHKEHDKVLQAIWNKINPKIVRALAGDNAQKELPIVKQLANGLIKYSNTATAGDVDIVKLIAVPGSPGYKLLKVDERLYDALKQINLIAVPGSKGVAIYGIYNNKKILLMKCRSYHSKVGNTVRTIIEGGDLLDIMAEVADEK